MTDTRSKHPVTVTEKKMEMAWIHTPNGLLVDGEQSVRCLVYHVTTTLYPWQFNGVVFFDTR